MADYPVRPASPAAIEEAAGVISGGGIVAFPTETFYGLAVDPFNPGALEKLFALKDRPPAKAVLVLIDEPTTIGRLAAGVPAVYEKLIAYFWPGPLTLIFDGIDTLPTLLTDGDGTVGIRQSSNPYARALAGAAGGAVTGTSANPSNMPAATSAEEVTRLFREGLDMVIDGGKTPGGEGSTILGLDGDEPRLIRAGRVPLTEIRAVLEERV